MLLVAGSSVATTSPETPTGFSASRLVLYSKPFFTIAISPCTRAVDLMRAVAAACEADIGLARLARVVDDAADHRDGVTKS
jgi:hypothetical protein